MEQIILQLLTIESARLIRFAKRKPGSQLTFSQIDGEAGGLSGSEDCPSTPEKQRGREEKEDEEESEEEWEERREEEEKVEVEEREERMVQPWNSGRNQGDYTIDDPTITSGPSGGDAGLGGQGFASHPADGSQSDVEVLPTELHPRPLERARARRREREASKVSSAPNQKYPVFLNEELEEILQARRLCVCGLCTYPPVICQDI